LVHAPALILARSRQGQAKPGVEEVAEAVAEEVNTEDGEHEREPREGEPRLGHHVAADAYRRRDEDGSEAVRKQMTKDDGG
jgi:hypothetical protein